MNYILYSIMLFTFFTRTSFADEVQVYVAPTIGSDAFKTSLEVAKVIKKTYGIKVKVLSSSCSDTQCQLMDAKATDGKFLFTIDVTKIMGFYVADIRVHEISNAQLIASVEVEGRTKDGLVVAIKDSVAILATERLSALTTSDTPKLTKRKITVEPKKKISEKVEIIKRTDKKIVVRKEDTRKISLELYLGVMFGDVERSYDTRIGITPEFQTFGIYEHDSWITGGPALRFNTAIGYKASRWLETSLHFGFIQHKKFLSTGWEVQSEENPGIVIDSNEVNYDPTESLSLIIEPRVHIRLFQFESIEPYFLSGLFLRFFDGYEPPNLTTVKYSPQPGGVHLGCTAGLGIRMFLKNRRALFFEVPFTFLLNAYEYSRYEISESTPNGSLQRIPEQLNYTNQTIAFNIGYRIEI